MIAGMRPGNPAGNVRALEYYVQIEPDTPARRRLSWVPERTVGVVYHVIFDAVKLYVTDLLYQTIIGGDLNPRAVIEVIETSPQNEKESLLNVMIEPGNRVRCTWDPVDGATSYELYRKLSAGSYGSPIYTNNKTQSEYEFMDSPLTDGSYVYKLVSLADEGDNTFDEEPVSISTVPEPPTNIAGSWNPTTHVLTLTWTASPSADLNHYAIRHNNGSGPVRIDDAAEDTEASETWQIDLTGLTGDYEFLVRAVDNDSKEEQNLSQMIAIGVVVGVAQGRPANPDNVRAEAISGGKARVSFIYFPDNETGFASGVAKEARIYSDGGTGIMDWITPVATVLMNNPTNPAEWSWDSGVLANDTYLFAVRIATDTGGAGFETQNTDTHEVTTNDSVPGATDLVVAVA